MIKKIKILLAIFAAVVAPAFSQRVELDFPKLDGDTAWIYLFSGSRVDSLACSPPQPPLTPPKGGNAHAQGGDAAAQGGNAHAQGGDAAAQGGSSIPRGQNSPPLEGLGVVTIPQGYRGFAYLYVPEKGGGEFILAEENVRIRCEEEQFHGGMLEFPNSDENTFLRWSFQQRNNLMQRQEWLQTGEMFMNEEEDSNFDALYNKMVEDNSEALQRLDSVVKNSTLYAARFMELVQYMQRLYDAVQSLDSAQQRMLKEEMEKTLDINALYHSGNLWTDVHSYYPGLFYGADSDSAQTAYAHSILAAMRRLEEPVLTAFLSTALIACERTDRQKAQEVMLTGFIMEYPTLPISDDKVKRMLGALSLNKGAPAPQIVGLETAPTQPVIVIFFDSDCDHCRDEIEWLTEHYSELTGKGYRIISIAADIRENNYRNYAAALPWDTADRLCDFKGTEGENFKNYGVIGTPTIFVIDEKGTITGKYAQMKDLKIDIDKMIKEIK